MADWAVAAVAAAPAPAVLAVPATSVASQRARGEGRRSGADPAVVVAVAGAAAAVAAAAAAVAAAVVRCRRGMRPPIRRTSSHTFSPTSGCSAGRRADAGTRSKSPSTATLSTNTFATNLPAKRGKAQGKAIARARSSDVRAPTTPVAGAPCLARGGARLPGCRRAPRKRAIGRPQNSVMEELINRLRWPLFFFPGRRH